MNTDVEQHYSVPQAAGLTTLSRTHIHNLIREGIRSRGRDGIYPVRRLGRRWLIPASSLQKFLDRGNL